MKILFKDLALPQTIPFSRLHSIFSFRNGIYTPIERARKMYGDDCELYITHPDATYTELIAKAEEIMPHTDYNNEEGFDVVITSEEVDTLQLLDKVKENIIKDFELVDKSHFLNGAELMDELPGIEIIGDVYNLYIAKNVNIISRNIVIDTREGIVIIDSDTVIGPFTIISGNTYIGIGCEIINARISHDTIIGDKCRVSGEVSSSIINDNTYKSHEGFLGRTILGRWVNLGAQTTTSNLKNNYSEISLWLPESIDKHSELIRKPSGNIKYGSLIGDYVKTAIGVMVNCGTVIDTGCNVMLSRPSAYIPPLRWLDSETKYNEERFISDCKMITGRKGVALHSTFSELVRYIFDEE